MFDKILLFTPCQVAPIPYPTILQSTAVAKSFFESPRHWTIASPPTWDTGTVVGDIPVSIGLLYQLGYLLYFLGRSFYWFDISATWGQFSNSSFSTSSGSPIHCVSYLDGRTLAPLFPFLRLLLSRLLFELVFSWRDGAVLGGTVFSLSKASIFNLLLLLRNLTFFPQADVAESQFVA